MDGCENHLVVIGSGLATLLGLVFGIYKQLTQNLNQKGDDINQQQEALNQILAELKDIKRND